MKKFITAAAFLAASTALANAATLTYAGGWDSFGSSATTAEKLLSTDSDGASMLTGTFSGSSESLTVPSSVTLGNVSSALDKINNDNSNNNTNSGVLFVMTFSEIANQTQTLFSFNLSGYGINYVLTPGENGLSDATLAVVFSGSSSGAGTSYEIGSVNLDTSSGNVTIAFGFQRNTSVRSFLYASTGESLETDTGFNIGGNVQAAIIGGSQIVLASSAPAGNFTAENFYAYKLSDSALTSEQVADLVDAASARAIPEPSAFGLLAGVGALALVAARRRRRAK